MIFLSSRFLITDKRYTDFVKLLNGLKLNKIIKLDKDNVFASFIYEVRLLKNYSSVTLNPDIHQDKLRKGSIFKTNIRYFAPA